MTRPDAEFRPDIDGLRALAILLVVAYHAHIPGLRAGFFGVDVFFVISGYLITRNLIGEAARDGTVRLARFWARRVRRLVPALACAVVGTLVVGAFVLSPLELHTAVRDALSSSFYVSNITFALRSTYYFAPRVGDSLLLHTWSLGVEEQFYLLWPLLTVAAVVVARRTQRLRSVLAAMLATGGVISFALALHYTARGTPWSFFGLPTRAWEFAVAGLLANVRTQRRQTADGR